MFLRRGIITATTGALLLTSVACYPADDSNQLHVAMAQPPTAALSPFSDDALLLSRWSVTETLVTLDSAGEPEASLATDWTHHDSGDWEIELRTDVRFHDGTMMDAESVETAITAADEASNKPRVLDGIGLSAEATGEHTLTLSTTGSDPLLIHRLASPQLAILANSAYSGNGVDPIGAASGPYRISDSSNSSAQMKRFDDYWGDDTASMSQFKALYMANPHDRVQALRASEVDVAEDIPPSELVHLHEGQVQDVYAPHNVMLYLNTESGDLEDSGVREAVRESIDVEPIINDVFEGHADEAEGIFGPAVLWDSEAEPDFDDAASIDGESIDLATYSDSPELPEVMSIVEQQLESAGFSVGTTVRDYTQIEADIISGEFDAFLMSRTIVQHSGDPYTFLESDFSCGGVFNFSQSCSRHTDSLIADIAVTEVGDDRLNLIHDVERRVLNSGAVLPLVHQRELTGIGPNVNDVASDSQQFQLITPETHQD